MVVQARSSGPRSAGGFEYEFEASRLNEGKPEKRTIKIDRGPAGHRRSRGDGAPRPVAARRLRLQGRAKTQYDAKTGNKAFNLFAERTEWRIRHTVIKDAKGPYQPAAGDAKYWGESDYAPPAPPPPATGP